MRKDFILLIVILSLAITGFLVTVYYSNYEIDTTTWLEKDKGDGPWKLQSGNRDEEEALEEAMKNAYKDDVIIIKETPSAHEVIFSTEKGLQQNTRFHQSERMPEVKY